MASEPLTYLNGRFIPASQAVLSLDDLGFVWGATVTDRARTFRQKLFRLDDHLQRFRASCEQAFVPQPRSDQELAVAAEELVAANARLLAADTELTLVLFATPGVAGEPTVGMQARSLDICRYRHLFTDGAFLEPVACSIPAGVLNPHIKHRSRLAWWIAQQVLLQGTAARVENRQALFTTDPPDQFLRETAIANILVEIDGILISPPRSEILPGISLSVVEQLCGQLGIPFAERELMLTEVQSSASEFLLTNTSYCLATVKRLGETTFVHSGLTFQRLVKAWSDMVSVDIRQQFST